MRRTGLVDEAVDERQDPRALVLEMSESLEKIVIPDPLVVKCGESAPALCLRRRLIEAGEVVLERVGEVVRVAAGPASERDRSEFLHEANLK